MNNYIKIDTYNIELIFCLNSNNFANYQVFITHNLLLNKVNHHYQQNQI